MRRRPRNVDCRFRGGGRPVSCRPGGAGFILVNRATVDRMTLFSLTGLQGVLGRGLNPARFVALLDEFRQKVSQERIAARIQEVSQDELIALVKLHSELKARYLVSVLDLIAPNLTDLEGTVAEARRYRELAEEVDRGVKAVVDGVVTREIAMAGLEFGREFSPDIEAAINAFIAENTEEE